MISQNHYFFYGFTLHEWNGLQGANGFLAFSFARALAARALEDGERWDGTCCTQTLVLFLWLVMSKMTPNRILFFVPRVQLALVLSLHIMLTESKARISLRTDL
jgi:hypothetical protein